MDSIHQRAADIRLLVLDVDGVLTDGRLYFSAQGEDLKAFHVRDGAGIVQLLRAGLAVAVISGRNTAAVERRMSELGVRWVRQGIHDKLGCLNELLSLLGIGPQAVACVGDDTPDLPLLDNARLAVAVADAHPSVRERAHYVTRLAGGQGAVREVCDLILAAQGNLAT
ncbi:MAG: 3-deoxy-manno-octulosonate-8-phosphatase KdsC [Burkholderiaceae bacterium]